MKKLVSIALVLVMSIGLILPTSAKGIEATTQSIKIYDHLVTESDNDPTLGRYHTITHENGMTEQIPITYWTHFQSVIHGATKGSNGYVNATASVTGYNSNYRVSVTLTLQKQNTNGTWSNLGTWSNSSTYFCKVSGSYKIATVGNYRTKTVVSVYDTNNVRVDGDTLYSTPNYL